MIKVSNSSNTLNNIYIEKNLQNKNNEEDCSEKLKVSDNELSFYTIKDEGEFKEYWNLEFFDIDGTIKINAKVLDGVIEGENLLENTKQSLDKFLVNITNAYNKEKSNIETQYIGKDKEFQLKLLDARFNVTVEKYASNFSMKVNGEVYLGASVGIQEMEGLANAVKNVGTKLKQYIDEGNKPPTNIEEYKKFTEYISKNMEGINLEALSKFDQISSNMEYDGLSFEQFNSFLDEIELPELLKTVLRKGSSTKLGYKDPFREFINKQFADSNSLDKIVKENNEKKKYFENLLYLKTKHQEEAEKENIENNKNDEVINKMLDFINNKNRLNKNIFSGIKTDSERYLDFIKEMKQKNLNNFN